MIAANLYPGNAGQNKSAFPSTYRFTIAENLYPGKAGQADLTIEIRL
jgi:hypothetical protein